MSGCYTYVAAVVRDGRPRSPTKVGVSANPWARVHDMQTGSPLPLTVLHAMWFPTREEALEYEHLFHVQNDSCRLHGEWFEIEPWEALNCLVETIDVWLWSKLNDVPLFLHAARVSWGIFKAAEVIERTAEFAE